MKKKRIEFSISEWDKQNRDINCLVFENGDRPKEAHYFDKAGWDCCLTVVYGSEIILLTGNGKFSRKLNQHPVDIYIEVEENTVERWINLYKDGEVGSPYYSKEQCDRSSTKLKARLGYCKISNNTTTGIATSEIILIEDPLPS